MNLWQIDDRGEPFEAIAAVLTRVAPQVLRRRDLAA